MTCDEGRELIQHSIDSDLDSQETVLMNEHIRTCPDCAAFLERMTLLSKNLAELPRVAPPFSLVDAILPKLEIIDAEARVAEARAAQTGNVVPEEPAELPRRRNRSTLRRAAGEKAVKLIRREPDPLIIEMVDGWAKDFDASRAKTLGFAAESSFDEIIRVHIEDELSGRIGV